MQTAQDVLQSTQRHINGERLWQSLMDLARLGATVKGGVCRLALTLSLIHISEPTRPY